MSAVQEFPRTLRIAKASKKKITNAEPPTKPIRKSSKRMDSGKPNKSVKNSTSKDRRQKLKASAPEISANVDAMLDAMLAAEIDKLANVSTKAKSIVSNSSCKSALSLKLQMQKVLAEETMMLEEMKRRREFMKKKFELMEEIAEVQSCPVPGARTTDSLTKVKGWLQKQRQAENESVAADDDKHDSDDDTEDNMDDDEDDDAGDTESSSEYAADEEGDNSSGEMEPESDDSEDDSSSADESYHERGDEHHEERFSPRERSTPVQNVLVHQDHLEMKLVDSSKAPYCWLTAALNHHHALKNFE
nr:acidic leucine-rich nuclear phosphoprotein 32 family member B-like [Aedes albopictus]